MGLIADTPVFLALFYGWYIERRRSDLLLKYVLTLNPALNDDTLRRGAILDDS